jgi:hypothetical protein
MNPNEDVQSFLVFCEDKIRTKGNYPSLIKKSKSYKEMTAKYALPGEDPNPIDRLIRASEVKVLREWATANEPKLSKATNRAEAAAKVLFFCEYQHTAQLHQFTRFLGRSRMLEIAGEVVDAAGRLPALIEADKKPEPVLAPLAGASDEVDAEELASD